ncbi:MAG: NUDIX domain-containing protein [bacterium]|nr:NUDIX domain-containing protein [bacterium]
MGKEIIKDQSYGLIPFYKEDGRYLYLLIHHRTGHWAFPKGHPEKDETIFETIKREIYEETGITEFEIISDQGLSDKYIFEKDGKILDKTVTYYLGKVLNTDAKIMRPEEIVDYLWLDFDQASKKISHNSSAQILKTANNFLINLYKK